MLEQERTMPAALRDVQLIETLAALNRRNLPERVMHAKGVGARGYFQVYMPLSDYTCADFLRDPEVKTPVFARFSTTLGARGSADTARDERGFAVRFYTGEGNYDLLSSSFPVRSVSRPEDLPALIAALSPDIKSNLVSPERFWDFVSRTETAVHRTLWLFSDRGTLKSYRHMRGYSAGTYVWVNSAGKRRLVRYRWEPLAGVREINRQEAEFLAGFDPDAACRDLYDALEQGGTAEFELRVQWVPWEERENCGFDLSDGTLSWPEDLFPPQPVGKLILDRNPDSVREETEKAAFSPAALVPGIEPSADPMFPVMAFACRDAQRHRLGDQAAGAPVNQPLVSQPLFNQTSVSQALFSQPPVSQAAGEETWKAAPEVTGNVSGQGSGDPGAWNLAQAGAFYRGLAEREQERLIGNLLDHMLFLDDRIKERVVALLARADASLGERLTKSMDF